MFKIKIPILVLLLMVLVSTSAFSQFRFGAGANMTTSSKKSFEIGSIFLSGAGQDTAYVSRTYKLGFVTSLGVELSPFFQTNTFGNNSSGFISLPIAFGVSGGSGNQIHYNFSGALLYNVGINLDLDDKYEMSGLGIGIGVAYSVVKADGKESSDYEDEVLTDYDLSEIEYYTYNTHPFSRSSITPVIALNYFQGDRVFFRRSIMGLAFRPSLNGGLSFFELRYMVFF